MIRTLILLIFFSGTLSAADYQQLLDDTWAKRVTASHQIYPAIEKLDNNISELDVIQRAALKNLKAYYTLLRGDATNAIVELEQLIAENVDIDITARAQNILVSALAINGQIKRSFMELYKVLEDFEKIESNEIKLHVLHTSVVRHMYAGIFDKALDYSRQLLAASEQHKIEPYYCVALIEAGNIELELENYSQAKTFYENAKRHCQKFNNSVISYFINYKLSKIHFSFGEYTKARTYLETIYNSKYIEEYKFLGLEVSIVLAQIYIKHNLTEEALKLANKAFEFAEKNNYLLIKRDSAKLLASHYMRIGNKELFNRYKAAFRSAAIEIKNQSTQRIADYYYATRLNRERS